jgi:hypothetical protein
MAKKQTRRSISVSRVTYERLKAFCEANNISMSQFVETRVGDFLGEDSDSRPVPRPVSVPSTTPPARQDTSSSAMTPAAAPRPVPMTSAAARHVVEPPPPIIKPKNDQPAPAPVEKTAAQIFTF